MKDKVATLKTKRKLVNRNSLFVYGILLWPIIHFCVFWVGMNFNTLLHSFMHTNPLTGESIWISQYEFAEFGIFSNFIDAFKLMFGKEDYNPGQILNSGAVLRTLSLIPLSIFVNLPLTLACAYGIYKKVLGYKFFRVVLFVPAIVSSVVLCLVFRLVVDPDYGVLPELIKMLGGNVKDGGWLYSIKGDHPIFNSAWLSILCFSVWAGISGNLIYFVSAMSKLPQSCFESASLDGATDWVQFFKIVLPMIFPTVITMMITLIAGAFTWFTPTLLLIGPSAGNGSYYSTSTIALGIVIDTKNSIVYNGVTCAYSFIVAAFGGTVIFTVKKLLEKKTEEIEY
jgi:ABC-type sugar transport system permease subunit